MESIGCEDDKIDGIITEADHQWWRNIPVGAESIVRQIAAEQLLLYLLDSHIVTQESQSSSKTTTSAPSIKPRTTKGVDFNAVFQLIRQFKVLTRRSYTFSWDNNDTRELYPLAIICCLQPPLNLLELVYEANPEAISIPEPSKGCLPFHYACTFEASCEVLDFLLSKQPSSIETPRNNGRFPLHLAIYFKANLPVVQHLHSAWPLALTKRDFGGWTALHFAARGQASLEVVKFLASMGDCAATDAMGRTPLHLACRKRGNLPVVDFLLKQEPQVLLWEDTTASTPLFCAARKQTIPILELLLTRLPPLMDGDVLWRDHVGATLLHYAALENTPDVLDFLVSRNPGMLTCRTRDYGKYLPLHWACGRGAPLANIRVLVEHAPRTLVATCRRGRVALEILRRCNSRSPEVELYLEQQMKLLLE